MNPDRDILELSIDDNLTKALCAHGAPRDRRTAGEPRGLRVDGPEYFRLASTRSAFDTGRSPRVEGIEVVHKQTARLETIRKNAELDGDDLRPDEIVDPSRTDDLPETGGNCCLNSEQTT